MVHSIVSVLIGKIILPVIIYLLLLLAFGIMIIIIFIILLSEVHCTIHYEIILAHTPDNSFLGFVISSSNFIDRPKQNYTLIIGKEASYLKVK